MLTVVWIHGSGQTTLAVEGELYLGPEAMVGIYGDIENRGILTSDAEIFGFYGNSEILVHGPNPIDLRSLEIAKDGGVFLQNTVRVSEFVNFVSGDFSGFVDPGNATLGILEIGEDAMVGGANVDSKSSALTRAIGKSVFTLPLGDRDKYRPLTFEAEEAAADITAAYLAENPGFPTSLLGSYPLNALDFRLDAVSPREFWILQGNTPVSLTFSWDPQSNLSALADGFSDITLAGWNIRTQEWSPLPIRGKTGGLDAGSITTASFNPDLYAAYTFARNSSLFGPNGALENTAYFLSPNGDGVNETLILEHLDLQGRNNQIYIFNRSGQKVFEFTNYYDQFTGFANSGGLVFQSGSKLPDGVYYYIVELKDEGLKFQGFFIMDH